MQTYRVTKWQWWMDGHTRPIPIFHSTIWWRIITTYIPICTQACTHIYLYIQASTHIYLYIHRHLPIYTYIYTGMYPYIPNYTQARTHIYLYIRRYIEPHLFLSWLLINILVQCFIFKSPIEMYQVW